MPSATESLRGVLLGRSDRRRFPLALRPALRVSVLHPTIGPDVSSIDRDLERWLVAKDAELEREGLEARHRPARAVSDYAEEMGAPVALTSGPGRFIFEWFRGRSHPHAQALGSLFVGAFYYQGAFWKISVPLAFGTVQISAESALGSEMPPATLDRLFADSQSCRCYLLHWADCVDWAYAFAELRTRTGLLGQFVRAANDDLHGASTILCGPQVRHAAYQSSRLAAEKSLKALLAEKEALTEDDLRKDYGHRLLELQAAALTHSSRPEFSRVATVLTQIKDVGDRYSGRTIPDAELWEVYSLALGLSAAVAREFSSRDTRAEVLKRGPSPSPGDPAS